MDGWMDGWLDGLDVWIFRCGCAMSIKFIHFSLDTQLDMAILEVTPCLFGCALWLSPLVGWLCPLAKPFGWVAMPFGWLCPLDTVAVPFGYALWLCPLDTVAVPFG
jgi:hypothetical protein